ncbi:outer membrane beta-barrel protein [Helicobacter saguini]|uniref:Outer membrane beta-barrel protein n=1 Tax=Helicobacter saguini TaxID=1548018 RepID=A0A347VN77_9HELI|nr:outer membrane beta-barrel protein [Helicobacter saguini]MWV61872.1 outer membrane beta-barrel protein [Helicobacter saguini]MWV67453.1 outer membrane beta-barrel protein [Helicobacter saguini]MWV69805.1 outer membrane beta-barrel protein [Helicobacter saguini]MWV72977.1 outer membrane beta-barrel protein [Helicobacter saguini]TLD95642.1 outer membrane beta-barrel protein [Helicobacter saguini]
MKKLLAIGALSIAFAQAGVFVGVQGGYDVAAGYASGGKFNAPLYDGRTNNSGWSVGANAGYELGLGFFGVRGYLQFDYSQMLDVSRFHAFDVDFNVDALINFVNSDAFGLGLYAGIGIGYQRLMYDLNVVQINSNNLPLFARLGLTFKVLEHSRIDVGVKLPITGWNLDNRITDEFSIYSPLKAQISYKFLF